MREIQQARKDAGLSPGDQITLYYQASDDLSEAIQKFSKTILEGTNSKDLIDQKGEVAYSKDVKIGKSDLWIGIKK